MYNGLNRIYGDCSGNNWSDFENCLRGLNLDNYPDNVTRDGLMQLKAGQNESLLAWVKTIGMPEPKTAIDNIDRNAVFFTLCTITLDENVRVKGQGQAYKTIVQGAAGVIHIADSATTDCQPNDNVETLRVGLDAMNIEARPVWKPMHKQPCYKGVPCYLNGVSEAIFKVGMCLPGRMSRTMM